MKKITVKYQGFKVVIYVNKDNEYEYACRRKHNYGGGFVAVDAPMSEIVQTVLETIFE